MLPQGPLHCHVSSNEFIRPWLFGVVASRILNVVILMSIKEGNLNIILGIVHSCKVWYSGYQVWLPSKRSRFRYPAVP